jgi:hypothetical protein
MSAMGSEGLKDAPRSGAPLTHVETRLRRTATGMLEAEKQFRTWRPGWPDPSAQASMTVTPTSTRRDARRPGGAAALHRR